MHDFVSMGLDRFPTARKTECLLSSLFRTSRVKVFSPNYEAKFLPRGKTWMGATLNKGLPLCVKGENLPRAPHLQSKDIKLESSCGQVCRNGKGPRPSLCGLWYLKNFLQECNLLELGNVGRLLKGGSKCSGSCLIRVYLRQSSADGFAPGPPARSMCYFRYFRSPRNLSKVVKCQEVSHFDWQLKFYSFLFSQVQMITIFWESSFLPWIQGNTYSSLWSFICGQNHSHYNRNTLLQQDQDQDQEYASTHLTKN